MWALSWMSTWWDYTNATSSASSTATVLQDAYRSVLNSSRWVRSPANITSGTPAQAHIHPGELGNKIFPFSDAITTSFFPMIYKQFNVETGSAAEDNAERLLEEVYAYFDANYGMRLDSNGDGVVDSFMYNTARDNCTATVDAAVEGARCETGDYSVWVTSNMVIGTLLPSPAENPDYLRNLFRGKPLFLKHKDKPKVIFCAFVSGFI